MIKKPETVGELFEHFNQKMEFDRASRGHSGASKLEQIDSDFVLSGSTVKQEAKLEYCGPKEEEEQQAPLPKQREVTQLLTIRELDRRGVARIKLEYVAPPARKRRPELQPPRFRHEDVWDPSRQLRCKMSSERICISNMVELPPEKHRLNQPRNYKPLEPLKKKLYRPAVPRLFRSGYDEFLERRRRNEAGEVDLGVWDVDEVLLECYKRDLIPLAVYNQFINTNGMLHVRRFLQAWQGGELGSFDFARTYFTLLDHRRLAELLLHCFPHLYTLGSVEALHPDVKEFIAASYRLNSDDYAEAYLLLDEISECQWWAELKTRLEASPELASYFRLKESINKPPLPAEMQYDKHSKSEYIRDLLGPIPIQDSLVELEKILSMKHKSNRGGENPDDSASTFYRREEEEEFEDSHDPSEMSSQHSAQGHKEKSDFEIYHDEEELD